MAGAPLEYDTSPWAALTDGDRAAWSRIRSERPQLGSPFFSLGWHDAIEATRADVEVLRIRRNGEPAGFLPFSRSPFGMLHPVGAPMADWHGLVGPADLRPGVSDLLRAARGKAFRFSGAPADDPFLQSARSGTATSFVMDLSDGYDAYEAEAKEIHPKAFRNLRARVRKLHERRVEIRLDDRDPAHLAKVLSMKRSQYRRTGQIDIFSFGWTRDLIDTLFAKEDAHAPESIRGLLSTLWIDGSLAAGHFGLQDDETLHYWFPVYDARFADLSPGIILLHKMAQASTQLGIRRIDLGDGDYRFKEDFANRHLPIIAGTARVAGWGRRTRPLIPAAEVKKATASPSGMARIPRALTRRVDLLSTLYRWSPATGPTAHEACRKT